MPFFSKPVKDLEYSDLDELLQMNAYEGIRLDFKVDMSSKGAANDGVVKQLSAYANTFGGYMIFGAASNKTNQLVALPGMDRHPDFEGMITSRCMEYIYPPITPIVSPPIAIPDSPKVCYVVYVNESFAAPHFLNGRKGAYIRVGEQGKPFQPELATLDELMHLANRRQLALDRFDAVHNRAANRFQQLRNSWANDDNAWLCVSIGPQFPSTPAISQSDLPRLANNKSVPLRGCGFPYTSASNARSQHESLLFPASVGDRSLLELTSWGILSHCWEVEFQMNERGLKGLHVHQTLGVIFVFVRYCCTVFPDFGVSDQPLTARVTCGSIRGKRIYAFPRNLAEDIGASVLDDEASFLLQIDPRRLSESPDEISCDIAQHLFFALGRPFGNERREELKKSAYDYNSWQ